MKKSAFLALAAIAVALAFGLGRCSAPHSDDTGAANGQHDHNGHAPSNESTIWTCSMHPQVRREEAGQCPICGMDLIPLDDHGSESDAGAATIELSPNAIALADVQTAPVERRFPEASIRLVGTLAYDETREKSLTARYPARIDELYVNFTGIPVKRGEHLAAVYSPELLTAQRELLTAHAANPQGPLALAAREKLRLWDLLPEQIEEIIERGEARDRFDLRAPIGGVVVAKSIREGDYVKTGELLFRIVDLSHLWLNLSAYESDLPWLRYGQTVSFTVEARPGETFTGTIVFIDPELDRASRTVSIRVNVPNEDNRLKPGMFARGVAQATLADDGAVFVKELAGKWISPMHPEIIKDHPGQCDVCGMDLVPAEELGIVAAKAENAPLVVPASAALRTGKRAVVYVQINDGAGRTTFEGRVVELGPRAGDVFIVRSGLQEGERVVTNGAFKIDSALQIQAKPSMMNPAQPSAPQSKAPAAIELELASAQAALPAYLDLQRALAGDDLAAAKTALAQMSDAVGERSGIAAALAAMQAADTLDGIRRPHFDQLSQALIAAVKAHPDAFGSLSQMHCPMVYPDRGADWLQASGELRNPYFGQSMLTCGEVVETHE